MPNFDHIYALPVYYYFRFLKTNGRNNEIVLSV